MYRLCAILLIIIGILFVSPVAKADAAVVKPVYAVELTAIVVPVHIENRSYIADTGPPTGKPGADRHWFTKRYISWLFARSQKGKPYIWGGTGPQGYDCSGLVYTSYGKVHLWFGRSTYDMLASGKLISESERHAHRGDLVFFNDGQHVEFFVGHWKSLWTYGAAIPGTDVGFHKQGYVWWYQIAFYRVKGSLKR